MQVVLPRTKMTKQTFMIKINDLTFKPFLSETRILEQIKSLSQKIEKDYRDKAPLLICVLKGSFMFTSEVVRNFDFDYEIAFVRVKSYDGTKSASEVKEFYGLDSDLKDRHIIILEDIVETGFTTHYLIGKMESEKPASIEIATLLFKPKQLKYSDLPIKYVGFDISNEFVVGFGLDYNEKGRNLRDIYQLNSDLS